MSTITSLCVYCGSRLGDDRAFRDSAERFGSILAEAGIRLVYGGGAIGIMGVIADAVLASGGRVTGIIPRHLQDIEVGHAGVDELIVVPNMHERKRRMSELADGFVILPGGLGTLDEMFEAITWKQLGLHDKPIVIADIGGYWSPLRSLLEAIIDRGFASGRSRQLYAIVDDVDGVLPALAATPEPVKGVKSGWM